MNSKIDLSKLEYRKGVIGIVIDKNNEFLITQLIDYDKNDWRFPGGGVDGNENSDKALLRELKEELSSNNFEIIKKSKHKIKYDWPLKVVEARLAKKGKTYKGQIQEQYLVLFKGNRQEIKLNTSEVRRIKWVKYLELKKYFNFPNQWKEADISIKELLPKIATN